MSVLNKDLVILYREKGAVELSRYVNSLSKDELKEVAKFNGFRLFTVVQKKMAASVILSTISWATRGDVFRDIKPDQDTVRVRREAEAVLK